MARGNFARRELVKLLELGGREAEGMSTKAMHALHAERFGTEFVSGPRPVKIKAQRAARDARSEANRVAAASTSRISSGGGGGGAVARPRSPGKRVTGLPLEQRTPRVRPPRYVPPAAATRTAAPAAAAAASVASPAAKVAGAGTAAAGGGAAAARVPRKNWVRRHPAMAMGGLAAGLAGGAVYRNTGGGATGNGYAGTGNSSGGRMF